MQETMLLLALKTQATTGLLMTNPRVTGYSSFAKAVIGVFKLGNDTPKNCVTLYKYLVKKEELKVVTKLIPSEKELDELLFSWKVVKHVKSNAIVITNGQKTVGIGAGQMNRVGAAEIALEWAKEHKYTKNLTLASDAFFPFDDVVKLAKEFGVTRIIQPGGSIRDKDSIKACNELGIEMVFTGNRHFKH